MSLIANSPAVATSTGASLPITTFHNVDGTVVDATGGSGKFKVVLTLPTSSALVSQNAHSDTITSSALIETNPTVLFQQGNPAKVIINAQTTGTLSGQILTCAAYAVSNAGLLGANLVSGSGFTTSGTAADYTFTIPAPTPGSTTADQRILIEPKLVITEGAGGTSSGQINSVRTVI